MKNGYTDEKLEAIKEDKQKSRIWSVVAFALGLFSVAFCFLPWLGIALGVVSIVLCVVSRLNLGYFDRFGIAALFIAIFGIVFGAGFIVMQYMMENTDYFDWLKK